MSEATIKDIQTPRNQTLELLILALPIVGMMVTRLAMTTIDVLMVARLGTEALAAISPASLFVFTIACLGMGVAHGVQTFVSQADGRGEPRQAGAYAWQSFYIAGICGLLTWPLAATTEVWFGWLAAIGHHSPNVTAMEIKYIKISLWAVAPSVLCIGLNAFFSGVQKPRITLIAALLALAVNALGNWLLIFGKLGFPRLEIEGAAIATVIGWFTRVAVLAAAMLLRNYDQHYNTRHSYAFCWDKMKKLLRVGAPTAIQWLVEMGSWVVFMVLIMPAFGTVVMAATNLGLQLMHLSFMPALGIGIALCSQVGFAIGEGQPDKARRRTWVALRVTVTYMAAAALLFVLAPRVLIRFFTDDSAVITAGVAILIWAAIFQVFDAMCITFMNALRGAGDTRWPAVVMSLVCWIIFVGGGYSVAQQWPQWGLNGPWSMCTLYIVVLGILLGWRWQAGRWRNIRLFDGQDRTVPSSRSTETDVLSEPPVSTPRAIASKLRRRVF